MKKAFKHLPTIVFLLFIYTISILFIALPKKDYSAHEKRYLADFPTFTVESFFSSDFGKDFETALCDHTPFRNFFVGLNSYYNLSLGNPLSNGIYHCKDGYLLNDPAKADRLDINFQIISDFAKESDVNTTMLLAPSTGYVCSDVLPNKHIKYNDDENFEKAKETLKDGGVTFVDVRETLKNAYADGTQVFYKTDHHWTTEGAYLSYCELAKSLGFEANSKEDYEIESYDGFYGTTYSSSGYWLTKPDTVQVYKSKDIKDISVSITEGKNTIESDSMFFLTHVDADDKYPIFLDGNHPYTVIKNNSIDKEKDNGKLLILKDSFAHSLTPFLADHYREIVMVDMRYYRQSIKELLNEGDFDQMLFIYSIDNLSTDTDLAQISIK